MDPRSFARLDKKSDHVVRCGSCGEKLGYALRVPLRDLHWDPQCDSIVRLLCLDFVWQRRELGVYEMPARAVTKVRQGKRPTLKRQSSLLGYFPYKEWIADYTPEYRNAQMRLRPVIELPARLVCWRCSSVQIMEKDHLHLDQLSPEQLGRDLHAISVGRVCLNYEQPPDPSKPPVLSGCCYAFFGGWGVGKQEDG